MAQDSKFDDELSHEQLDEEQSSEQTDEEIDEQIDEEQLKEQLAEEEASALNYLYAGAVPERIVVENDEDDNSTTQITGMMAAVGPSGHTVNAVVEVPSASVAQTIHRNDSRIRHGLAAAVVSVLVLFGIGLGAGMYYRHVQSERHTAEVIAENERKAAEAEAERTLAAEEAEAQRALVQSRTPRPVKFIISAFEYDENATRIPMVVTGIDFEGNEVNTEMFVNAQGEGISLVPGSYTATIPASPILPDGTLYDVSTNTFPVQVDDNADEVTIDQAIVLIPLGADKITEDMVVNASNWARKDAANADVSEANAQTAIKAVEDRLAREREKQKQDELNATRSQLAQQFASAYFTNISLSDSSDDSKIMVIANWSEIVGQYVAPGSSAQSKLSRGPDPEDDYTYTISATVASVSGYTAVVDCKVVSTSTPKTGWTRSPYDARVTITFNDNNKIVDFTIS